jgi:hypothetical protein
VKRLALLFLNGCALLAGLDGYEQASLDSGAAEAAPAADSGSLDADASLDSGAESSIDGGTDSGSSDASSSDAAIDASSPDADADTCPLPTSPATCSGGQPGYDRPATFFFTGHAGCAGGFTQCAPVATPAQCQCAGTYNCACVMAAHAGGYSNCAPDSGYNVTCDDSSGTVNVNIY